ncbi:MAG: carboxypeptidase-like regulatory domain-containing protein [Flavobacteriales bacterium]|nr:carboxypeptidase-like regulatory domain-containing protein [Flavobacteriales bacterium]MCB9447392.1 carboxypeptidase-like regulatory domain-containing protein [Flavobacteriales bacterium]
MRQEYKLNVPTPCTEDWTSMTKNDLGRHCSHCAKTVVDFTGLTDAEILNIIQNASGGLCGRLNTHQLNRPIITPRNTHRSRFPNILAGLLLIGTGSKALATKPIIAQTNVFIDVNAEMVKPPSVANNEQVVDSLKNVIQGKVLDAETKEPIVFATVQIQNTETGVATDINGEFKLVIPDGLLTNISLLIIRYVGYEDAEIAIRKEDLPLTKEFLVIPMKTTILGELTIIRKKRWWQFWKRSTPRPTDEI